MTWQNPKIDWAPNNAIGTVDMNRIEGNAANRRGYIDGFILSWNTGSYLVNISPGMVCINDFTYMMITGMTKSINGTWVLGTGNGGRAAGTVYPSMYWFHIFVLGKSNGLVDIAFDDSGIGSNIATDPNILAAGFTAYRRIGSLLWTHSAECFRQWKQYEDTFFIRNKPMQQDLVAGDNLIALFYHVESTDQYFGNFPFRIDVIAEIRAELFIDTTDPRYILIKNEMEENTICRNNERLVFNRSIMGNESLNIWASDAIAGYEWSLYSHSYIDLRGKSGQVCID